MGGQAALGACWGVSKREGRWVGDCVCVLGGWGWDESAMGCGDGRIDGMEDDRHVIRIL